MEKDVGKRLPHTESGNRAQGHKPEPMNQPGCSGRWEQDHYQFLPQEYTRANQNEEFYSRRDKPAPVKSDTRRAIRRAHDYSLRCPPVGRQNLNSCASARKLQLAPLGV